MIDSAILGIAGLVLGIVLFDQFARLGGWGRLIGFGIALAYFAPLNSALGKGKTVGKTLMGIEVVDTAGNNISLGRSALRYTILGTPFFLNGAMIPPSVLTMPVIWLVGFLVFGLGGATIYLIVFNRGSRQSVHDLVVGTYVVRGGGGGRVAAKSIWRGHLIIVGAWCVVALLAMAVVGPLLAKTAVFSDLLAVQKAIQSSGKVHTALINVGTTWTWHNGTKEERTFAQSSVFLKERPTDIEATADKIASIILATSPEISKRDMLAVSVAYGYDIGIARAWNTGRYQYSPSEWQARLRPEKKGNESK
jgi:uncharacterized RDD family membrane protein YckC